VQLENALQVEVSEKLTQEVGVFAKENGIEVVLNWGLSGEGVLYGAPGFDVTEALLEFMNERYEEEPVPASSAEATE
jgi:Skp family chaperone for outer membrane proteins